MIVIECIISCLLMFGICYFSMGSDEKNLKSFDSYPIEIQNIIRKNKEIKEKNKFIVFISNFVLFSIILFIFGIFIKENNFKNNFFNILILGEVINVFDLLFIDFVWFRNSKRVMFSYIKDIKLYKGYKQHVYAFIRALFMFLIIAFVDGIILTIM